ncbi:hypothetical protein ACP2AV_07365 [Aliiroseovarius sp. PTFE2010]|uniref:hypothetical protein n=1 Tax=Aliiroseovarius sp. PTFE2010 TaxID=3417190 RepID=UPI003CEFBBA9
MDEFLGVLYRGYLVLKDEFEELRSEAERRLHPLLEVIGGIIMAVPFIWVAMWLFGS